MLKQTFTEKEGQDNPLQGAGVFNFVGLCQQNDGKAEIILNTLTQEKKHKNTNILLIL